MHNITRLDYKNTHGWWVRIKRRPEFYSKLFSDGIWGGKEEALEEARNWRDDMLRQSPKCTIRSSELTSKGIKTGIAGLSLSFEKGQQGLLPHLQVSIQRDGKRIGRRYSISKWGMRAALWKACVEIAKYSVDKLTENTAPQSTQAHAVQLYSKAHDNVRSALAESNEFSAYLEDSA